MSRGLTARRVRLSVCLGLLLSATVGAGAEVARAGPPATLNVTTQADPDPTPGCQPSACSLREAVIAANASPGSTINLPAGHYVLRIPDALEFTNDASTGDLDINADVTIKGAGAATTTIDANGVDRAIYLAGLAKSCPTPPTVSISGVTVTGGGNGQFGAGIDDVCGKLSLSHVVLTGNTATGGGGGLLIDTNQQATVDHATISANKEGGSSTPAPGGGAVVVFAGATLTMTNSLISANTAGGSTLGYGQGGGVLNEGTVTLVNDTITGNGAAGDTTPAKGSTSPGAGMGGGIFSADGAATDILNTTIADNAAGAGGTTLTQGCGGNLATSQGCLAGNPSAVTLKNTIVSGGTASPGQENCAGLGYTSHGHNLEQTNQCAFSAPGDLIDTDPKLAPLADNGGATQTRALMAASPAINAGDNAGCPATDQRDVARPQAGVCDIGAFELVFAADLAVTDSAPGEVTLGSDRSSTITVTNRGPQPAAGVTLVDTLPAGYSPTATAPSGLCSGTPLTCALGDMPAGSSRTVTVTTRPQATGPFTDSVTVSGTYADPDSSNNGASATTQVTAPPAAPQPTPPPSPPPPVPPVITSLTARARCVRAATVTPPPTDGGQGLSFSYLLNERASVQYTIRRHAGSHGKRRCTGPTGTAKEVFTDLAVLVGSGRQGQNTTSLGTATAARSRRRVGGARLVARPFAGGRHRISLAQVTRGASLRPGTYVLFVSATNAAGQRSNIAHVKFFVLGP